MKLGRFRKLAVAAAAVAALAVPAVTLATAAQAAVVPICTQGGAGKCLNDWNGGGINNTVKMFTNQSGNENFGVQSLSTMCGSGHVTSTCPFSNHVIDGQLLGASIVKMNYFPNGLCTGSGQNDDRALLEACPGANGTGGGWGTVMVESNFSVPGCHASNGDTALVSVHWTNVNGSLSSLTGGETNGFQATFIPNSSLEACWGNG